MLNTGETRLQYEQRRSRYLEEVIAFKAGRRGSVAPVYVPPYSDPWTEQAAEGRELLRSVGLNPATGKPCG